MYKIRLVSDDEIYEDYELEQKLSKLTITDDQGTCMKYMLRDGELDLVLICFDDDEPIGWCVNQGSTIHTYVARAYRRQGIGSALVKRMKPMLYHRLGYRKLRNYAWDKAGGKLYRSVGMHVDDCLVA